MKNSTKKPLISFKSRFNFSIFLWSHPVRIFLAIIILSVMQPELKNLLNMLTGVEDPLNSFCVFFFVFLSCVGLPMITTFLEYRLFSYKFYEDHVAFRHSLIMTEQIKIPYKTISNINRSANWMQRRHKLVNLQLSVKASYLQKHEDGHILYNVPSSKALHKKLNYILKTYHDRGGA